MAPKTGRNRRAHGCAHEALHVIPEHGQDSFEELMADPGWCDIEALPVRPEHYILFNPPATFMQQMVADRANWARDVETGVVRAIARAIAGTCLPWHADWSNWRAHASDFFSRLCSHRMARASQTDGVIQRLEERITSLEKAVVKLIDGAKAAAPVLAGASHTNPEEVIGVPAKLQAAKATASVPSGASHINFEEDIDTSVFRAHLRAVASRSPEPRRAVSQLLGATVAANGEARSLPDVSLSAGTTSASQSC